MIEKKEFLSNGQFSIALLIVLTIMSLSIAINELAKIFSFLPSIMVLMFLWIGFGLFLLLVSLKAIEWIKNFWGAHF